MQPALSTRSAVASKQRVELGVELGEGICFCLAQSEPSLLPSPFVSVINVLTGRPLFLAPPVMCLSCHLARPPPRRLPSPSAFLASPSIFCVTCRTCFPGVSLSPRRRPVSRNAAAPAAASRVTPQSIAPRPQRAGTTSLLLSIQGADKSSVDAFVERWLRDYIFSANTPLSAPVSVSGTALLFYASDGAVRYVFVRGLAIDQVLRSR